LYNLQTRKNIGKAKGLLHSLVPRAHCFRLYGVDRQCAWSSDGAQDFECDSYIADLAEAEIVDATSSSGAIRRTLKSGRTLLVLPIPDEKQGNLGLVVVVFSRNAGKSSSFNPDALATILRPAIELIGESLILSRALVATRQRYQDKEKELALVYEVAIGWPERPFPRCCLQCPADSVETGSRQRHALELEARESKGARSIRDRAHHAEARGQAASRHF
jgi:hypothetical protein